MDIRGEILTQATRLFAEQGYDGTTVQEIADAVGIRKPSLLYHFKSKDELREQVIAGMLAHWNALLPGLLLKASTEERFDATMEALTEFFIEDPSRARLFLRETLDRPESMQAMLAEFVRSWVELLSEQLERAKAQGLVQPDIDPQAFEDFEDWLFGPGEPRSLSDSHAYAAELVGADRLEQSLHDPQTVRQVLAAAELYDRLGKGATPKFVMRRHVTIAPPRDDADLMAFIDSALTAQRPGTPADRAGEPSEP